MGGLLQGIGVLTICFAIVYGYGMILDYYALRQSAFPEDERVYRAAEAFARGAPPGEVRSALESCPAVDAGEPRTGRAGTPGGILTRSLCASRDLDAVLTRFLIEYGWIYPDTGDSPLPRSNRTPPAKGFSRRVRPRRGRTCLAESNER